MLKFNPRWRSKVYEKGILLVLFLNKQPLRQVHVKSGLEHVTGPIRGETFFVNVRRLMSKGWIVRKRIDVIPKRIPKSKKLQKYQNIYPVAYRLTTEENHRGRNHIKGRYEVYLGINSRLPLNFVGMLKYKVANFFGFASWYDGLYCQNRSLENALLKVRNSFSRVRRDMTREPSPSAEYKTENVSSTEIWRDEAAVGDDESSEPLKLESTFLPPAPQCLRRERNRAHLPEQSTAGHILTKEGQGDRSFQGRSEPGKNLVSGDPDRTF